MQFFIFFPNFFKHLVFDHWDINCYLIWKLLWKKVVLKIPPMIWPRSWKTYLKPFNPLLPFNKLANVKMWIMFILTLRTSSLKMNWWTSHCAKWFQCKLLDLQVHIANVMWKELSSRFSNFLCLFKKHSWWIWRCCT